MMQMCLNKPNREKFPEKAKLIKQLNCLTPRWHGYPCCEVVDPAHFRSGLFLGANIKDDKYINPLCRVHHTLQGHMGEKAFWGDRLMDAKVQSLLIHIAYLNNDIDEMHRLSRLF